MESKEKYKSNDLKTKKYLKKFKKLNNPISKEFFLMYSRYLWGKNCFAERNFQIFIIRIEENFLLFYDNYL